MTYFARQLSHVAHVQGKVSHPPALVVKHARASPKPAPGSLSLMLTRTCSYPPQTRAIVDPLNKLIHRYAPPGVLTTLHPVFLQVSPPPLAFSTEHSAVVAHTKLTATHSIVQAVLSSRLYQQAEALLAIDIADVDTTVSGPHSGVRSFDRRRHTVR